MTKKKSLIILLAVIFAAAVLIGSLIFATRARTTSAASDEAGDLDDEAMRVLNNCALYCANHDFSASLNGSIKASVFGVPYSLTVSGSRSVSGDDYTEVEECASAFVRFGLKKGRTGGEYFAATGEYNDNGFTYTGGRRMDEAKFISLYGLPHDGLIKYVTDGAVVSASVANENEYKYILDPARATEYYKNEIKTLLKTDADPVFDSVELTIVVGGDRAVKVTSREKLKVDKFGGTRCVAEYTEVFDYSDD